MSRKKKTAIVLSIVLPIAGILTAGLIALGIILLTKTDFSNDRVAPKTDLRLNEGVILPQSTWGLERRYLRLEEEDGVYTLVYREKLPDFFEGLKTGDVFCITPDKNADQTFFIHGFSGRVISKSRSGEEASVSFTVPDVTELFPELNISLASSELKPDSVLFIPGQGSFEQTANPGSTLMAASPAVLAAFKVNEMDTDFSMKTGNGVSLLDDYAYICDELKIKTKTQTEIGPLELELDSRVIFEDLAVKSDIAYHTDESTGEVVIDNYDIGVISKHRMDMTVKPSVSAGLDDINGGFSVIDFKDATDAEDGKIVLGTFLVGFYVPFLESDTNNVSYLSLGLAIQLTLTAEGELSMECRYEQSGYSRIEVDSEGNVYEEIRGYDYPNPVVDSSFPTAEQLASLPDMKCSASGEIRLHAGLGIDAGLCIFGTVPVKISNNIVDIEYHRSQLLMEIGSDDPIERRTEVLENGYMLDDYSELFKVSVTSFLRLNIGLESDLDVLNMTSFDIGAEAQLFNRVLYQYPDPVGFTREQCDFGGIQLGESYTSEELTAAYKQFQRDTKQYSIIGNIKDQVVNSAITGFVEGLDPDRLPEELEIDWETLLGDVNVAVFSPASLYLMDSSGTVVCEIIAGKDVMNCSGFGCGANTVKTEILYSAPAYQESAHVELGEYFEQLLGFGGGEITMYLYESSDSDDVMFLLYSNGELRLIIAANEAAMEMVY